MKKSYIVILLFLAGLFSYGQQNVGIGVMNPDPSALLDLSSQAKGFLVPRMNGASRLAIPAPATGLLVYDTDSSCVFFYTGTVWQNMCNPNSGGKIDSVYFNPNGTLTIIDGTGQSKTTTLDAWLTKGNSGTTAPTNFAGTTDAQDFVLKSNNAEVLRVTTAGAVGINQPAPNSNAILDIESSAKGVLVPSLTSAQRDAIAGPIEGLTIYNNTLHVHQFWNGTCWVNVGQTVCSFDFSTNFVNANDTSDCLFAANFSSVSDTIQVNLVNGTPSPVVLTAVGVPAGVIASFSNNYLLPPAQSIMTFTALPSAVAGTYRITILATSGSTVQTLYYTLVVFGYNLSINPIDTTVSAGNLTNGGYISQAVVGIGNTSICQAGLTTATLSATGAPGTINVSFASNTISLPGSTVMTITSNCPLPGTYNITVQAQIGGVTTTGTYTLTITPRLAVHISSNQTNLNLSTYFGNGHCPGNDTVVIDPGVTVCSANPAQPALTTGTLPNGSTLTIINNGSITGAGGDGGSDPTNVGQSPCPSADGGNGGDAIFISSNIPTQIINNGTIASGGGGGGAGQALTGTNLSVLCNFSFGNAFVGASGGGGAGCSPGAGGANASCNVGQPGTATTGGPGGPAPATSNGCGCTALFGLFTANSGAGGRGGNLGQPGTAGSSFNSPGNVTLSTACPSGQGGAAGYSVNGNGCSCVTTTGTALVGPTRP